MTRNTLTHALVAVALLGGCLSQDADDAAGNDDAADGRAGSAAGPVYPTAHPRIYLTPNKARLESALSAKTAQAVAFQKQVDEWVGGADQWGFSAWNAALMGQLTGQAKYCTAAIAAIQTQVTAANTAIAAGDQPDVSGDSYLYVGDDIGDLALVYDWCNSALTAAQKTSWRAYADQAVYNVWNPTKAKWGTHAFAWDGWATDDPSDNYYYSFLRATMLLGLATYTEDTNAPTWLSEFRTTKVANELDPQFNTDLVGGASREGTSYGVAMRRLWELYDWWEATTGEGIATKTPQTEASMRAAMHQTLPTIDRVAPTGDQARDSTASYFDYNRQYLQELVALYPGDAAAPQALYQIDHSTVPKMSEPFMAAYDFLYAPQIAEKPLTIGTAYYASGIGELYARSGWDVHATWLNLIAGPYTESHAHQDQGSLMLFKDGWLAYDAVVGSHSGLRQETNAHSLVRIQQGATVIPQKASTTSKLVALQQGSGWLYTAADVTAAYGGATAVTKVQREIVYLEPNAVVVFDRVATATGTTQTWQLASPVKPVISGATSTFTNAGHTLSVQRLAPASATMDAFDYTKDPSDDYASGFRLDETVAAGSQHYLHVMSIDKAVTSAVAVGDNSVTLHLADGRTAVVTFRQDTAGGATLVLAGVTTVLGTTVGKLAL